jgi:membrane associated rhomboid family serine protease
LLWRSLPVYHIRVYRAYQPRQRRGLSPVWLLIGLNVILFIVSLASPQLILSFGLVPQDVAAKPWTVFTSLFLHASFGHILANMITLYFFGKNLQLLIGSRGFLMVYFIGGLLGSLMYVLLAPPLSIAIGASGAVFAVGGALAVMRPKLRVIIFPVPVPVPLWGAVVGGFVILSFLPNVAWQAHLGGLAFGLAAGYFYRKRERSRTLAF